MMKKIIFLAICSLSVLVSCTDDEQNQPNTDTLED